MKIRYEISRRKPGSKSKKDIEYCNHSMILSGNELHSRTDIFDKIRKKHPGWAVIGYAPEKRGKL